MIGVCSWSLCGWSVWLECVWLECGWSVWLECVWLECGWSVWLECVWLECGWSVWLCNVKSNTGCGEDAVDTQVVEYVFIRATYCTGFAAVQSVKPLEHFLAPLSSLEHQAVVDSMNCCFPKRNHFPSHT